MTRVRLGCLGCLGRFVGILMLALVAGTALIVAIDFVFTPWAFYLGGTFHPLAVWQGTSRFHASSGDYTLSLWMAPTSGGRVRNLPNFRGWGTLCTPRGEVFSLRVTAAMFVHPGTDTNGQEMRITMSRRPWYFTFAGTWDNRPSLTFRGRWQNADLVANDGGTVSMAFLPDGSLYTGPPRNQPHARETLPVVIHSAPWTAWFSDCRAVK